MDQETKKFVNKQNARPGQNYHKVIEEIAEHKVCPFCPENINKYHKNPILIDGKFWLATDNMYPYPKTKNHLIFIHKNHIENVDEINKDAWAELHEQIKKMAGNRKMAGGSFVLRFGDTEYTGASVTHLHAHLIQSDPENKEYDKAKGLSVRVG
jgi:diadenosine tetraphosphate (Ap4A) HIT family hydrolase